MSLQLRAGTADDLPWLNACYARVEFQPSRLDRDTLVIAELNGRRVGAGRLVNFSDGSAELGGMYVDDDVRRQGVAGKIVERLIELAGSRLLYCIPFVHLSAFYQRYGFIPAEPHDGMPKEISSKLSYCETKYTQRVELLVRSARSH